MKGKLLAVLLLLVALAPLIIAVPPGLSPSGAAPEKAPGYEKAFTVEQARWVETRGNLSVFEAVVTYYGGRVLLDVKASLEPGCGGRVVSPQPVMLGSWPNGVAKTIRFTVNTSEMGGKCEGAIAITWDKEWDPALQYVYVAPIGSARLRVDTSFCGTPSLSVKVHPSILYLNGENVVTVEVGNTGRFKVTDVDVEVNVQGASVSGSSYPVEFKAAKLDPGEWRAYTLRLVPSSPAVVLTFRESYANCMGEETVSTATVALSAVRGQAVLLAPVNGSIPAGATRSVSLRLVNLGSTELRDVKVTLSAQGAGVAVEPQLLSLGDVAANGEREFAIRVAVPETAVGSIPVSYTLSYVAPDGSAATLAGSFTLFVVQSSQVYVTSVDVVPSEPKVGDILVLSVSIVNDGGFPVYGVNVSAFAAEGLKPLRATYSFLGRLEAQAVTSVPFSYRVETPGEHRVTFTVVYRDAYGNTHRAVRSVTVNAVQGASRASGTGKPRPSLIERWWPLVAALIGVAAVAAAWKLVKRR